MTSNSKIWNLEKTTFELLAAAKKGPVVVDLAHEGPCCEHVGLNQLLDNICELMSLEPTHFVILTSNQLHSSKYPEKRTKFIELEIAQQHARQHQPTGVPAKRFGIFIGRSNADRLGIASYLYSNLQSQTEISFHYEPGSDFHTSNFGLEDFLEQHWDQRKQVFEFLDHVPIKYDEQTYPISWNYSAFDLQPQYQRIFCDIVCETYTTGQTFFLTEKTLRCIANKKPFVVSGPRYYLANLQKLGFQTFSSWWDEGYDCDPDGARYQGIIDNINWIAKQEKNDIEDWYIDMQPVLEHNHQVLLSLTNKQILGTQFVYDQG